MTPHELADWLASGALASVEGQVAHATSPSEQAIIEWAGLASALTIAVAEVQALGDRELSGRLITRMTAATAAATTAAGRVEPEYRDLYRAAHLSGALRVILDMAVRELRGAR